MADECKFTGAPGTNKERTYLMLKPDGVARGLLAPVIQRFTSKGMKLVALKMLTPSKERAEAHYADLAGKKFFPGLIEYITSGPVVAMVWEGKNIVLTARKMLGATNPAESEPGTIRGDFCVEVGRNILHGSDATDSAEKEIAMWFTPEEVQNYSLPAEKWIYE